MKFFVYTNLQVEYVCVLGNWIKLQEHKLNVFLLKINSINRHKQTS
jgi:hypothetical protein